MIRVLKDIQSLLTPIKMNYSRIMRRFVRSLGREEGNTTFRSTVGVQLTSWDALLDCDWLIKPGYGVLLSDWSLLGKNLMWPVCGDK